MSVSLPSYLHNTTLRRVKAGKPSIGTFVGANSATVVAVLARAGIDHLLIDSQHGEWDERTRIEGIRAVALQGMTPMVRVVSNSFAHIGRALDSGALGIIVPMVNNAAEAKAAAQAMRYPPAGARSTADPLAIHYPADYGARANDEVFLAVQIETKAGLENVEEIMAVEGVDATLIGPADLALTIGAPIGSPEHDAAIRCVLAACQAAGKIPGMFAATTEIARRWIEEGYLFVTVSGDLTFLNLGARAMLDELADLL